MLIKQNQAINNRFWEILDIRLPNHSYQYVGCCGECGAFELREQPHGNAPSNTTLNI